MVLLPLENTDARAILIFKIQALRLFASGIERSNRRGKILKSMNIGHPGARDGRWEIGLMISF